VSSSVSSRASAPLDACLDQFGRVYVFCASKIVSANSDASLSASSSRSISAQHNSFRPISFAFSLVVLKLIVQCPQPQCDSPRLCPWRRPSRIWVTSPLPMLPRRDSPGAPRSYSAGGMGRPVGRARRRGETVGPNASRRGSTLMIPNSINAGRREDPWACAMGGSWDGVGTNDTEGIGADHGSRKNFGAIRVCVGDRPALEK
jgi:hypothetical protein